MNISLQSGSKCQATLRVEVPAELVQSERENLAEQYVKHAKIPGYRPGKAPRKVIEKRFEKAIQEQLEKILGERAIAEARKKEDVSILQVQSQELIANVDDTCTVTYELIVAPSFELSETKGIAITLPNTDITDEHVEKMIERWQQENADYKDEPEDTGLAMGQYAVVDYQATKDGEPIDDEGSPMLKAYFEREDAWIFMDEGSFLPGFCGELLEHKAGDEVIFKHTLADDFPEEKLKGQEITFAVKVKQIKTQTLPELTDEKISETSQGQIQTAVEFTKGIGVQLENQVEHYIEMLKTDQVLAALHSQADFELPEEMVTHETQQHLERIVQQNEQRGIERSVLEEQEDQIVDTASKMGSRDVKSKFILNKIATDEGLQVEDSELQDQVRLMAARSRMSPKKAMGILQKNGQLNSIAEEILFAKALDFVKENASVSTDEAQNAIEKIWEDQEKQGQ